MNLVHPWVISLLFSVFSAPHSCLLGHLLKYTFCLQFLVPRPAFQETQIRACLSLLFRVCGHMSVVPALGLQNSRST